MWLGNYALIARPGPLSRVLGYRSVLGYHVLIERAEQLSWVLGISSPPYPPEVDVEQHALGQQHEVVEVPVSDPQQVRHDAAAGAAPGEVVQGLAPHPEGAPGVRVVIPQELQHTACFVPQRKAKQNYHVTQHQQQKKGK